MINFTELTKRPTQGWSMRKWWHRWTQDKASSFSKMLSLISWQAHPRCGSKTSSCIQLLNWWTWTPSECKCQWCKLCLKCNRCRRCIHKWLVILKRKSKISRGRWCCSSNPSPSRCNRCLRCTTNSRPRWWTWDNLECTLQIWFLNKSKSIKSHKMRWANKRKVPNLRRRARAHQLGNRQLRDSLSRQIPRATLSLDLSKLRKAKLQMPIRKLKSLLPLKLKTRDR